MDDLADSYRRWIEEAMEGVVPSRDDKWTESVAVGSEAFVTATKEKLGFKAKGREVIAGEGSHQLKESPAPYTGILAHENAVLRPQNEFFWENNSLIPT
jgi:putative transposase